jgi:RimJ/RimL family protein N-acetyltransferase
MILETKRLVIREYTSEDFDALYEILSDAETMKYYPKPYDENGVRRWIVWCIGSYKQNGFGLWALELKETGAFIGDCGISMQNIDGEILPEIGYHVNKKYWRQGYAKEACAAVKDWLFQNTDFEGVYSYMNQENVASCATAAANGMTKIKAYENKEEKLYVYRITREEWEKSRNKND